MEKLTLGKHFHFGLSFLLALRQWIAVGLKVFDAARKQVVCRRA
ncbi:hypothetical protein [Candidatus Methylacidithermus pantelleriae]|uniref:Uncharacterized protein n=1 Tax=Candidatus Methylacidithermus pantelleriae TaxID=2744239 RepID=A0A8J2BMA6_9BACT|nr:hypothetical protein [Candidatus Methylacidithermus pantelleriae]CAF0701698.1 hypothetical protein MPNT_400017 [Candidatus Methylacidithermus pantelleriae]